ncbi:serine/threonine-protein kinase [Egbenema bharatensis]|uniref:serine/threonine-protein kinase n=1 Tax=Egbenema bharatensis TaxID=3463334 RepID=UPI003A862541
MSSYLGTELKHSKYRLLGLVGQGQFGRVFCAVHRRTGKLVALKSLERQRFPTHKFLRELRILLSLQHPNIVTCQALEQTASGRCLVMDYCEGGTLRSLMMEDVYLNRSQSLKLVADILAGLEHAHQRGVVHCDIKPENILLSVTPTGWIARISDFGIARLSQELNEQDAGNTGSPAYMAPERFYGQYSLTSDLYAVGILLFELLAGYRPFSGTPTELMSAHLNRPVQIPDTIPAIWHSFLLTALQKLSARRFRSAKEMLAALQLIATTEGSGSWLDRQMSDHPLLQPISVFTLPLRSQHQEFLEAPLTKLAAQPVQLQAATPSTYLYGVAESQISLRIFEPDATAGLVLKSTPILADFPVAKPQTVTTHPPIQAVFPRSQGCFVMTQRSIGLIPSLASTDQTPLKSDFQPILEFAPNLQNISVAIEPAGRWMAILTVDPTTDPATAMGTLQFQALPGDGSRFWLAPHPIKIPLKGYQISSLQLLVLDNSHVAVIAESIPPASQTAQDKATPGTIVKVFTRRGTAVGTLNLPVLGSKFVLTLIPDQLMAVDRQNLNSVLLIDLKPYRISRLGVEIVPDELVATPWGYLFSNQQGTIVALDREGRHLGKLQTDLPITALTWVSPHSLLIATWHASQGHLHTVDLRESGLDLLF